MAGKLKPRYQALIEQFPLCHIKNLAELKEAALILSDLMKRFDSLALEEQDYALVLADLVHKYEMRHRTSERLQPAELLKTLMAQNFIDQAELGRILNISSGRVSEILSGKRELSKTQIIALADLFKMSTDAFLR